ncbi:MAG: TonB-dependent receptor [Flavobacteriaceae bacterium]|nr:TonB-dependent receptor [Flavobacteriaceae bacterium]
MKVTLKVLLVFCFSSWSVQAQNLAGTVYDNETKTPIPGATIMVQGTNNGTTTDFDGNFILNNVSGNDVLIISYLGFESKTLKVNENDLSLIYLDESAEMLDEIVVTGYGSQRKRDITGAVSFVDAKQIDEIKPIKIEQALQGTVAGVNISTQSGAPGAGINIRIRGISTNGDASPVAIIDGYQGDLGTINPADIESITVLKDAQAAIYGTIGANGVILVTTKRGRKNTPTKITLDSSLGYQQTSRKLPLLNAKEYGILLNEAYTNDGRFPVVSNTSALEEGTNWQDKLFKTAPIVRHSLTLNGGSETTRYSISGSFLDQEGIIGGEKSGFQRNTLRSNVSFDLSDKIVLNTNITYTNINRKSINDFGLGSILFNAINIPPIYSVYDDANEFTLAPTNLGIEIINPLAQLANTYNNYILNKLNGTIGLEIELLEKLKLTTRLGFNAGNSKSKNFSPVINYGGKVFDVLRSTVSQNRINDNDFTFDAFLNYAFDFDAHHFQTTLGTTIFKSYGDGLFATGFDIPNNSWENADISLANGIPEEKATGSYTYDQRRLSYFGRVQYDYAEKIFVSALLRRDASTKFGPQNLSGIFPSFTAGYVLSQENFLANNNFIDFLKIRASYGFLGSDKIGDFRYLSQLNGEGVYVFDDTLTVGRATGVVPNSAIKWEASEQLDFGVDFTFYKSKFNFTADYFKKTTNDLLLEYIPVSGILGTNAPGSGSPTVNAGEVVNKGFEFMLSYKENLGKDFTLSASVNATTLENEVTKVANSSGFVDGGSFGVGQLLPARMEVGYPIGYFLGYHTDGIFQNRAETLQHPSQLALGAEASPGDFRYKDLNDDGVINDKDRASLGDPIPDYTFGINLSLNYKRFDFLAYAFASIGHDIIRNYERVQVRANKLNYYIERWRGEGTSNSIPRLTTRPTTNNVLSDFFVEDGSFLRLQTVQLGYTLSETLSNKLLLDKVRVSVTAENLVTLTKYKGFDPAASNGAPIGSGIDNGFYPIPTTLTAAINLKF